MMQEIASKYNPKEVEDKWYKHWMDNNYFHSKPDDREPFTIVIPPPNVTGMLHMGHMLNNTIQDVLIRKARLDGKNACWVPGTDHASIATEAKVVKLLREKGIKKSDLSREEFMKHAWEWKEKYGGIILQQLRKLGCSCDWERTGFTMDPDMSEAVIDVFIDLYNKGYLYRGKRMINWDPKAKTALSNEEVIYKEVTASLYYVKYKIKDSDDHIMIATTRPETILGDTAICVNPTDERYKELVGKTAIVPMIERPIPIIADDYVDMEFGTGALKITPAHDPNDYEIGLRHNLEIVDTLNEDGTLNEAAQLYVGQTREEARKSVIEHLIDLHQLMKEEELTHKVGYSERTDEVVEPRLSLQWFLDMQKVAGPAIENVMNNNIQFHPKKYKNVYNHWMTNVKDWCISRQLWWGQRIPAYYFDDNDHVVAKTKEEALQLAIEKTGNSNLTLKDLHQDEDVVDTWFSSWLWPISLFDGFKDPNNKEFQYYYPTSDLVTGWDIIFFWVARMIIAGYEYKGEKPFSNVYFTGMVRDKQRRKMSKSLGNSPDPLALIEKYGADAMRVGVLLSTPAGNDILFDESLLEQGRNFINKIWNALRLINSWEKEEKQAPQENQFANQWIENKFYEVNASVRSNFEKYRLSDSLMSLYTFTWDDFCSWYLEMIKPSFGEGIDAATKEHAISVFENILKMLHPFIPFVTEEAYHLLSDRKDTDDIIVSSWPGINDFDANIILRTQQAREVVSGLRDVRNKRGIKPREKITAYVQDSENAKNYFNNLPKELIKKLAGIESFSFVTEEPKSTTSFVALLSGQSEKAESERFFVKVEIDAEVERQKLEDELKYTKGFLQSVMKKLENEKFVSGAPDAVVAKEKQKKESAEEKIRMLEESLQKIS